MSIKEKLERAKIDKKMAQESQSDEAVYKRIESGKYVAVKKSLIDLEQAEKTISELE